MSEEASTKICPLCAETIKVAAKVCPHCRHWQKKWSLQNPQVVVASVAAFYLVAIVCLAVFIENTFGNNRPFAEYKNEIIVQSSTTSFRTSNSNLLVTVVGTLTNKSDFGWKNIKVEAQFYDKTGSMIDVIIADADTYQGPVILPNGAVAFKIERKAARPETDYSSNKIFVRYAKDIDARF